MLNKAEATLELNAHERKLIERFLEKNPDEAAGLRVLVLKQVVENPLGDDEEQIDFAFGFALACKDRLVFFRVQDHLRNVGLARRALRTIIRKKMV